MSKVTAAQLPNRHPKINIDDTHIDPGTVEELDIWAAACVQYQILLSCKIMQIIQALVSKK